MDATVFSPILFFYVYISLTSNGYSMCQSDACCELWDEMNKQCKVCSPGYLGPNCSEICPYPNYGRECQEMCKCEENRCDVITGCYPQNDGCRSGYFGRRCVNRCKYPNYGKGCQFHCLCIEDFCNHKTGCDIPNTTISMSSTFTEVALTQTKDSGESELSLFKVFLISAVSSILVSVIIALVVWQVRKPRLSSLSSSENACRWTNQSAYPGDVENNETPSRSYSSDFNVASFIPTKATEPDLIMHRESSASTTVYELGSTLYEDVEFIVGSVEKTIP
ncbi:uncharacterized protein LOC111104988 [Crassostrea virginica]